MVKEYYIDGLGNISVQGAVVTLTMTREPQGSRTSSDQDQEILHLTMTGPNLIKITNILNNTLKKLAQRKQPASKDMETNNIDDQNKSKNKKDKTVN